jgi:hypothetical protein
MMGRIIGRHSRAFCLHEIHFFEEMWSPGQPGFVGGGEIASCLRRLFDVQRVGYLAARSDAAYEADVADAVATLPLAPTPLDIYTAFLEHEARRAGRDVPVDQTPRNVFYLREILDGDPGACIVRMVRDPRDVVASQKRKWRRRWLGGTGIPVREALRAFVNYHPATAARLWRSAYDAGARAADDPRVLTVSYESLLAKPSETVAAVCAHLGLPFERAMLEVPRMGSSSQSDGDAGTGIDPSRLGRWRDALRGGELWLAERFAEPALQDAGYVRASGPLPSLGALLWLVVLPAQLAVALLLNLRRMRNVLGTLRRRAGAA